MRTAFQKRIGRRLCLLLALLLLGCTAPVREADLPATPIPVETETPVPLITPTPTPTPSPAPTPTPTPTPSPTPVPTPFSLAWIPDTQKLTYHYPEILKELGEEIVSRRETDAILGVLHTGDIADNGWKSWQWDNFDSCLDVLREAGLPFWPVAGNHDLGINLLKYGAYLERPFLKELPEGQTYLGGKLFYILIEAGGIRLLLLGVGWDGARDRDEQEWVDGVLDAYADVPCILVTHAYLAKPGMLLSYCNYLNKQIVAPHSNVRLVLCGHMHGFFSDVHTYDDDGDGDAERTVNVLMLDNQDGLFLWRTLTFDPVSRSLTVVTHAIGSDGPIGDDPDYGCPADFILNNAF